MSKQFRVEETEWTGQQVTRLPDPLPEEIADHLTRVHGTGPGRDMVAAAHAHMLAHVRGEFTAGIHFHEKTGG